MAERSILDCKAAAPEPVSKLRSLTLRLQNEPLSLPQPWRRRQNRADRLPTHTGDGNDVRCLRARKLQTVRLHEPKALFQIVGSDRLSSVGERAGMNVGRDGRLNDAALQQPDR